MKAIYDKNKIDWEHLSFSNKDLWVLLLPLFIENMLNSFMGMADSMMVTRVGSAAISAVSLTDSINTLVMQLFQALAAGGAIICSQYIGSEQKDKANEAARQLFLSVTVLSFGTTLFCLLFRGTLLHGIFGSVEQDVMDNAMIYFLITMLSFPAIAYFQMGAAFLRAGGNSRFTMTISLISNTINILGNYILIFVFHMGVTGAALSTLASRVLSSIVTLYYLRKPNQIIILKNYFSIRPNFSMIRKILTIGIPSGIENSMFQFGKLAIQSSVSTLGTQAIAAQAMMIIFENVNGIGAMAIGIGLMTVAGQCLGAGKVEECKYYIVKHMCIAEVVLILSVLATFLVGPTVMRIAGMEPESARMCYEMLTFVSILKPIWWSFSFILPYGMRAAGDVRYMMIVSSLSMWLCRVLLTTVLIRSMGFGPIAVWIGMAVDWFIRGMLFLRRFLSGRWLEHRVI